MDAERANHLLAPTVRVTVSRLISVANELINDGAVGIWKRKLRSLVDKLTTIQGVLQDADEKLVGNHDVDLKRWFEKVRDVTSKVEDVVEDAAYENLKSKVEGMKKKVSKPFLPCLSTSIAFGRKMVKKIDCLIAVLDGVMEEALVFGFQSRLTDSAASRSRQTLASFTEPVIVGRKVEVSMIVHYLLTDSTDEKYLSVVSIVGMGGIGKTTVARSLLHDDRIKNHFGKIMWVCVSDTFDVASILVKMLESLTKSPCVNREIEYVCRKLKEYLRQNNCLLILDDVWIEERNKWEELRSHLLDLSKKASIFVLQTTRSPRVAEVSRTSHQRCISLSFLSDSDCLFIIRHRALGDYPPSPELEVVVRHMTKKCRGYPLSATLLGSILRNQKTDDAGKWILSWLERRALKEIFPTLFPGFQILPDSLSEIPALEEIFPMLFLGFQTLPEPVLKLLFAFSSIFPKNFVMEREMLIQLWMAEGYLPLPYEESDIPREDSGDKYFNDLLSYSLLEVVDRDLDGSIISCTMHDLILDLARFISGSEAVTPPSKWFSINQSNHMTVRHMNLTDAVQLDEESKVLEESAQNLLTLFSNRGFSCGRPRSPKRLRVLSLCGADTESLPSCFENLKRLRYLDISGTQMKELPKFIPRQYYLQTLRFKNCKSLRMPPEGIGFLINLMHIYFDDEERMPANIGRLTSLQTLQLFFVGAVKGRKIEELGSLRKLRGRLEILNLELVQGKSEAVKAKLQEKALDELTLTWREHDGGDDDEVLEGLQPHSNLQRLSIKGYRGKNLAFGRLNNLVRLKIEGCAKLKSIPTMREFTSLKWLSVEDCDELIIIDYGAFADTVLAELFIKNCPKLKGVPVSGLSSLERIDIRNCRELSSLGDSLSTSICLTDLYLYGCPDLRFIPSLRGLTSLQNLKIWSCGKLESLPSGLSSCTVLRELSIWNCRRLISIPEELKDLHSLVGLDIFFCFGLRRFPEQSLCSLTSLKRLFIGAFSAELREFPGLISVPDSLEELFLYGWDTLTELPHQIQHLTTLKTLYIMGFNKLEQLPEWLGNLSSLKRLQIWQCSNLKQLPSGEAIKRLSKLKSLRITECPILAERYARETGPEWSKISHISDIIMNYEAKETIQQQN